jgi:hypothetical protein
MKFIKTLTFYGTHDVFFDTFHCLKKNWDFQHPPINFPMMFPTISQVKIYIKNIFDPSVCNNPYVLLCVLQCYIQGLQASGFNHLVPLIAQKEKFHVQPSALSVSNVPF